MYRTNSYTRTIFPGLAIGMSILLGGCQGSGQQANAGNQPTAQPATSTGVASAPISSYTPSATPAKPLSSCNLETVGAVTFGSQPLPLKPDEQNMFKGWVDASGLTQPSYWLRFESQSASRYLQVPVTLTIQRPDVASAHAGAPLVSGFDVTLPAGSLPSGEYHVYLAVISAGGTYVCDNGRHIDVAP